MQRNSMKKGQSGCQKNWLCLCQKDESWPIPHPASKINSKWRADINVKSVKEETMRENLHGLMYHSKNTKNKKIIINWTSPKLNTSVLWKKPIRKQKVHPGRKISANQVWHKTYIQKNAFLEKLSKPANMEEKLVIQPRSPNTDLIC